MEKEENHKTSPVEEILPNTSNKELDRYADELKSPLHEIEDKSKTVSNALEDKEPQIKK